MYSEIPKLSKQTPRQDMKLQKNITFILCGRKYNKVSLEGKLNLLLS